MSMDVDPADMEALKNLYERLSADDLLLLQKYINVRANRRVEATLDALEALIFRAFQAVRIHKGIQPRIPSNSEESLMDYGSALNCLRRGQSVCRSGWNGKGQKLTLQVPDEHSKMTLPYIYITTVQGDKVPWLASQTDMLATDWEIVDE